MEPNLLVGDRLFVTKFSYGYSKHSFPFSPPIFNGRIIYTKPKRGDVIVFKTPADNRTDYIKRLIGLPGDVIQFIDGNLYINNNQVSIPYKTNSFAYNTLAAFSIASELEIKLPFFQKSIENFDIPNGRGKIIEKSNYRIIDDSYNANFTSMVTGINSIKNICTDKNRKIIVLGDMLELGDKEIIFFYLSSCF